MSEVRLSYNEWAKNYDNDENKTRDLEAISLRSTLKEIPIGNCLEVGCGTGKNSEWFATWAKEVIAVDFSEEMLVLADKKVRADNISFIHADITKDWFFADRLFDFIGFSLILEHIKHLEPIFERANKVLAEGGYVYVGELHPYKQYNGSGARYTTSEGEKLLEVYTHHISEFIDAAAAQGWLIKSFNEFFDDDNRNNPPRIITLVFYKPHKS